jgi:hypothetical protein
VSQDGTTITQTGGTIRIVGNSQPTLDYPLQAGQFVELEVPISSAGCYIHADKPVGVLTFYGGGSPYGDAAPAWLSPIEQNVTDALIAPFIPTGNTNIHSHYAVVVTPTATRGSTKVSIGEDFPTDVNGGTWIDNGDPHGMSFYKMPLTDADATAAYYFTNPAGFLLLCYGWGNSESYYYLAYSAMRNLEAAFTANNIAHDEMVDHLFCERDIEFFANIEGIHPDEGSLTWYIGDVPYAIDQKQWSHTFDAPGSYIITMEVKFENESTETYSGTLNIGAIITAEPFPTEGGTVEGGRNGKINRHARRRL